MNGDSDSDDGRGLSVEDAAFFGGSAGGFLEGLSLPDPKKWVNPKKERKRRREAAESGETRRSKKKGPGAAADDDAPAEEVDDEALEDKYLKAYAERGARNWNKDDAVDSEEEGGAQKVERLPIKRGTKLMKAPKRAPAPVSADDEAAAAATAAAAAAAAADADDADDDDDDAADDEEGGATSLARQAAEEEAAAAAADPRVRLAARKHEIANLAADILADPENTLAKLRELRELCSNKDTVIGDKVTKLAMMSLCTVFKDLIPGYRIRTLTEKEKETTVSKDVNKLQVFEQTLLKNYQMYLQRLHKIIKLHDQSRGDNSDRAKSRRGLMCVAIKCYCVLLLDVTHFNYRSNIIQLVVPRMNDRVNEPIATHCCKTVVQLFKQDKDFDASQEVVKAMARVIKASNYRAREEMVAALGALALKESAIREYRESKIHGKGGGKKPDGPHRTRKDKKFDKAGKELDEEWKGLNVTVNKQALGRRQTETLNHIFATYFRVLKHGRSSPLLPAVMKGLAKHAHLIDAAFFSDLMKVLKTIMDDRSLSTRITLECVMTGCTLLSGQAGLALNIDVKGFHDALYSAFLDVAGNDIEVSTALRCCRLLLHERREVSLERVGAFVRRLGMTSMQFEPHQAIVALFNVRGLVVKYPKLGILLDEDILSTSVFRPELTEPEHSCPFSSPMWELAPLSHHYHPYVATHAKHVSAGAPSAGPGALPVKHSRATPKDLYNAFDPAQHGFSFNPPMKEPTAHPLAKKEKAAGTDADGGAAAAAAAEPKVYRRIGQFKMVDIRDDELQGYVDTKLEAKKQKKVPRNVFSDYCKGSMTWDNERLYMQKTALEDVIEKFQQHKKQKKVSGVAPGAAGKTGKAGGDGGKANKKKKKAAAGAAAAAAADDAGAGAALAPQKKSTKKKGKKSSNGKSVVA